MLKCVVQSDKKLALRIYKFVLKKDKLSTIIESDECKRHNARFVGCISSDCNNYDALCAGIVEKISIGNDCVCSFLISCDAAFRLSRALSRSNERPRRLRSPEETLGTTGRYKGECVLCLLRVSANGRFSFAEQTVTCAEYFDKMEM